MAATPVSLLRNQLLRPRGANLLTKQSSKGYTSRTKLNVRHLLRPIGGVAVASAGVALGYCLHKHGYLPNPVITAFAKEAKKDAKTMELSREERFRMFASLEFEGQAYMTPRDFLDSIVKAEPRRRIGRTVLSKHDISELLAIIPKRTGMDSSSQFFGKLQDRGLISYTEYLFLLSVLTRPQSSFKMAFNIFDTDGNQRVDKMEFQRILNLFGRLAERDRHPDEVKVEYAQPPCDTSIMIYLFGPKGKQLLKYSDFHKFIDHMQTEVLEIEFNEFAKGRNIISEEDFARILLRYTAESTNEEMYIERLHERIMDDRRGIQQEISFREFKHFCQFLNNLDAFIAAMRLYTYTDYAVTQAEFQRAVKISTGFLLEDHVIDTVFKIFDDNADGFISNDEFIARMKDRLHMGFRDTVQTDVFSHF